VLPNFPVSVFVGLKDELLAAQVEARSAKAQLEGEVALNGRLRTAISNLSASWELEPADESREEARGDALVDQLCYLGTTLRDRVRDTLHIGVKRAMAVVCSGFSFDMEVVSHGFVTDISKTDAENEEKLHALINDAEVPGERLAKLFEPEVKAETRTEACEPILGVKTHCKVHYYLSLSDALWLKWSLRFVNICLFWCPKFLYFLLCLSLYSSFGLLLRRP